MEKCLNYYFKQDTISIKPKLNDSEVMRSAKHLIIKKFTKSAVIPIGSCEDFLNSFYIGELVLIAVMNRSI
jgi:glycine cleavage system protein P-like pyridoxal-binding family